MTNEKRPEIGEVTPSQLEAVHEWLDDRDNPAKWRAALDAAIPLDADTDEGLREALAAAVAEQPEDAPHPARQKLAGAILGARPLDAGAADLTAPPLQWLLKGWMPRGRAGLFSGVGGVGKSRLALALAEGLAKGIPDWLAGDGSGRRPVLDAQGPVVYATWEDSRDEVGARLRGRYIRRQLAEAYLRGYGRELGKVLRVVDMADFGPLWAPWGGSGHVSTMAALTSAGERLRALCETTGARLLIVDPLSAAYAGDENARGLVRAFMSSWDAWARAHDCAVLLVSHPPKSDAETSGSTDWRAAARFVWTLGYIEGKPAKGEKRGPTALAWRCTKSNYGPKPASVFIDREDGVVTEAAPPSWANSIEQGGSDYDFGA